ncbi:SDR family NAD(P)-dependent oxidoreductase [Sphingopyxis flava]|uniref:Short chain dehydrogenase n=1 Tax=Sphingopyxis flava TaxID=1507287 RepID=A0A1T5DXZ0_9SPHN|nr:SDR family NAD(P)-dependent oxidoreductase [Sphingopyxis flava]SKB76466.1 short chain dehydrogenase [Sphingopyxis flava]
MDLGLAGKKVIMNGGAHGLGLAALKIFAAEGADVAFFSRDAEKVAAAVASIDAAGPGKVFGEQFDMTDNADGYRAWLDPRRLSARDLRAAFAMCRADLPVKRAVGGDRVSRMFVTSADATVQQTEKHMTLFKKAALALVATSMVAAPVTASAAQAYSGVSAVSASSGQSKLEGNSSWLIGLLGLLAGITAIIIIADNDDDAPVSP